MTRGVRLHVRQPWRDPGRSSPTSRATCRRGSSKLASPRESSYFVLEMFQKQTAMLDQTTRADQLAELRAILAAIQREAGNRGVAEVVDLAQRADQMVAEMLRREAR